MASAAQEANHRSVQDGAARRPAKIKITKRSQFRRAWEEGRCAPIQPKAMAPPARAGVEARVLARGMRGRRNALSIAHPCPSSF